MKKRKIRKRSKLSTKRRNNAILYPIYKMVSWDLLSFYSIEFLFYTITKGISASQVLILTASYLISKLLFQIPAVIISDYVGKRKTIILGNASLVIYMFILIFSPGIEWVILANVFCGLGYDLKLIAENNLLYDSVSTRGGDGIYTKINSKGSTGYYILDTVLALMAGYLFIINNYIPMYICLFFLILSMVLSIFLKDIYKVEKKERVIKFIKAYSKDIRESFAFLKRSKRIKAYFIFATFFYGLIKITSTYKSDLLLNMGVTEEQFSMIYAVFSLIAAISVGFTRKFQKYFRNKTLTVMSMSYIVSIILAGIIALKFTKDLAIPLILLCYTAIRICDSQWFVTEYTYLNNFTTPESRNKITFLYELIMCSGASVLSLIGAAILDGVDIKVAIILVGLLFLAIMIVILDYMKTRFGLKPSQYAKEDIVFKPRKEKTEAKK